MGFKRLISRKMPPLQPRKVVSYSILSAVGLAGVCWAGGVIGQFIGNYQAYVKAGHLFDVSGDAKIAFPDINFVPSFTYAVQNEYGHIGLLVVGAGVAGLVAYIVYRNVIENKDTDGRGFTQSKKGTYGTSGWMEESAFKAVFDTDYPGRNTGIPLGMLGGKLVSLPDGPKHKLNRNLAVFGTPGCGKTVCFVINQFLSAVARGESFICSDTKGELYEKTASYLRKKGYEVRLFNLVEFAHSDGWNCLREVNGDQMRADLLVNIIMKNTSEGKEDQFWGPAEKNKLKALILYVSMDPAREESEKTLGAVYEMICNCKDKELETMFHALPMDHPARAPYNLYEMAAGNDKVTSGVSMGLGARLQVLQNAAVRELLAHDNIDLSAPAKRKCAYFIRISDQHDTFQFISSLIFSFLFIDIIEYADTRPGRCCDIPVNFVLDEFPNIGVIPDFTKKLSTVRSRHVNVDVIFQSIPQLKNRYPDDQWREILDDCDTSLFLGANGDMTTEYVSKQAGVISVDVESEAAELNRIRLTDYTHSFKQSSGVGKRLLLNPDEVRCLDNDNLIVILRGQKPILLDKFPYFHDPESRKMHDEQIIDYDPGWEPRNPVRVLSSRQQRKQNAAETKPENAQSGSAVETESRIPFKEGSQGKTKRRTRRRTSDSGVQASFFDSPPDQDTAEDHEESIKSTDPSDI